MHSSSELKLTCEPVGGAAKAAGSRSSCQSMANGNCRLTLGKLASAEGLRMPIRSDPHATGTVVPPHAYKAHDYCYGLGIPGAISRRSCYMRLRCL